MEQDQPITLNPKHQIHHKIAHQQVVLISNHIDIRYSQITGYVQLETILTQRAH